MAARYWVGGGSSTNWNATGNTNWGTASGVADNASVPGSSDAVTFDGAGSGNGASVVSATITILSLTFTSGYTNTVTINATTTGLTIGGNFTDNTAHSWSGSGILTIAAASTITSGGKTFPNNVQFSNSNTKTLSGDWTILGSLTTNQSTTINKTTSETLLCAGISVSGSSLAGTANITLTGGTWTGVATNTMTGNWTIAGDVTLASGVTLNFGAGTLVYSSGTVTTTSNTLSLNGAATLNTNGISFNNMLHTYNGTLTINSLLSISGTFTISGAATFAGTSGFNCSAFTCSATSSATITFKNSVTYIVTNAFNAYLSRVGSIILFTSDDATLKANLTLGKGATCNVLASFTRIDASGGRPIITFNGTLTTCLNIIVQNNVQVNPEKYIRGGKRFGIYNIAKAVKYV